MLAAVEARASSYGGIAAVSFATGLAASMIGCGLKDLADEAGLAPGRVRRAGGGRKPLTVADPELLAELMALVEPGERGDPMSPALDLQEPAAVGGGTDGARTPGQPHRRGRIAQAAEVQPSRQQQDPRGGDHPDRDVQFVHINESVTTALAARQPVISVDTKKKELVGAFKNAGREWRPQDDPEEVQVYDFLSKAIGRASRWSRA